MVSGPVISVVSSVGCQTFAVTRMSLALIDSGCAADFSSSPGSVQRISKRNGKPPTVCEPQVWMRPALASRSRQPAITVSARPAA